MACFTILAFLVSKIYPLHILEFSFNPSSDPGTNATFNLDTKGGLVPSFTICSSVMISAWTNGASTRVILFKLLVNGEENLITLKKNPTSWDTTKFWIVFNRTGVRATERLPDKKFPLEWTHACLSVEASSGRMVLVVDGVLLDNRTRPFLKTNATAYSQASLVIGEKLTGKCANVNVFSSPLPEEKMKRLTTSGGEECGSSGDLISWRDSKWILYGTTKKLTTEEYSEPCRSVSTMNVFHMEELHFHSDCMEHCQKMGGTVCTSTCIKVGEGRSPPVTTLEEWNSFSMEVAAISPNMSATIPKIWLASVKDVGEEWKDFYTNHKLGNFTKPWSKPDHGISSRKCYLTYLTNRPQDQSWDYVLGFFLNMGCVCQYESQPPVLRLWGVLPCSALRSKDFKMGLLYIPKQMPGRPKELFFVNKMGSQIRYNRTSQVWNLIDAVSGVTATSKASKQSYLLGRHRWTVTGDNSNCKDGKPYVTDLKLSGCNPEGEFTCDNGQCIPLSQLCDQLPNCKDKSDEFKCNILVLEAGYNKRVPPVMSEMKNMTRTVVAVPVQVSLTLFKVVDIEEENHAIEFQFEITLEWKENRATYQNLKDKTPLNALAESDVKQIWTPLVIYENTDDKEITRLGENWEWSTSIFVKKEGTLSRNKYYEGSLHEVAKFYGPENTLQMQQAYTHKFQCIFQLEKYPFDTQVKCCSAQELAHSSRLLKHILP